MGEHDTPRRLVTIGSPASWGLALLVMILPFLSVSCDTPGGFGRMEAGGTTTWSGADLVFGTAPSVDESHLRPPAEQQSDDIGWQPILALGALAIAAALVVVFVRPRIAAGLGAAGAALLVIGELVARSEVVDLVTEQVETLPPGGTPSDHVAIGIGFWASVVLALIGAALAALPAVSSGVRPRMNQGG